MNQLGERTNGPLGDPADRRVPNFVQWNGWDGRYSQQRRTVDGVLGLLRDQDESGMGAGATVYNWNI